MHETNPDTPQTEQGAPSAPTSLPGPIWSGLVLVAFFLGLGAGYMIWAAPQAARASAAEEKASAAEQETIAMQQTITAAEQAAARQAAGAQGGGDQQVQRYDVPEDNNPVWGNADAPITIIEFSDYECPYCQRWHNEAWPKIKEKYGDKVRLVFRDFPLTSIHPNAIPAAEAANCAAEQDQYFAFSDLLFGGSQPLGPATYEAYAQEIGLDMEPFKTCVAERRYQAEVEADLAFASQLGVRSTPTFFINGLAVIGAQPFEVFDQIIGMELAGEIPR
jgi:protein-disulfide isomerase